MDLAELRTRLLADPAVRGLHDVHAWTITSGMPVLTAHVVTVDTPPADLLTRLRACVTDHVGIPHTTLQVERGPHPFCALPAHS
ncbi:hypothetical protein ACFVHB_29210 [Kitasatospora sp. NPDC127111]|uniref:cation transporter dimerization domain-containing protein n=1 Tax=Kitasatospora sp. NPDC127111 TaxID=3345363 RepID=UPI00363CADB6